MLAYERSNGQGCQALFLKWSGDVDADFVLVGEVDCATGLVMSVDELFNDVPGCVGLRSYEGPVFCKSRHDTVADVGFLGALGEEII